MSATSSPQPLRHAVVHHPTVRVRDGQVSHADDRLAGEEPMEIRAHGPGQPAIPVAVTMRTPGHDFELAAGFLYTEGLVEGHDDVGAIRYCGLEDGCSQDYNIVTVALRKALDPEAARRNFYATSSCGVCGKATLDQVAVRCEPVAGGPRVPAGVLLSLPETLRARQRVFDKTGGLHAAALFDPSGDLVEVREDVGRHNAVDKLVGWALLDGQLPLSDLVLLVSGRAGFEIVQKAAMARVPIVCAVSAPSSLAVETARRFGVTLVGFLRDDGFNVYAHPERVAHEP